MAGPDLVRGGADVRLRTSPDSRSRPKPVTQVADAARSARTITARRVFLIALPVAAANATVPLQGAVDTAVIGNLGIVSALAAIGLGAQIFSLLFGGFNFLQFSASGFSSQALGAGAHERVAHTLLRGLILATLIALVIVVLRHPVRDLGLALFEASAETEAYTARYVDIRIFGAPAELMNYALLGWFAGQEMTRQLLLHQLALTLSNIALNLLFVLGFGWGVEGVALGTLIASYLSLGYGLWLAFRRIRVLLPADWRPKRDRLMNAVELGRMLALNRDIFIRTLLLIGGFVWMMRLGSLLGDDVLAANVVLWQFFALASHALDGFAIAAESLVGQSIGAADRRRLDTAVRVTTLWSGVAALAMSVVFVALASPLIDLFTVSPEIRLLARDYALWATLIPVVGFLAFQFDGVFTGATASAEMRNAMIAASLICFPASWWLMEGFANHGVWAAAWLWLALRAGTLIALYPGVRARAISAAPPQASAPTA